ncbi:hypothetical protein IEQ34_022264 [Dendrobium chrysotoxum]|uniref:Enoyl reductase (ER) domain-containing protein n=1 Tax=Dendrobium chrysotoxum TaxID=161865 RepID=A0AAV7FX99_DENCH|nr:hypothetical protein IEQ34_022264 [Dendrobium chrysotoxum]
MNVANRYVTIKHPIEGKPLMSDFEVRTEQLTLEIQKGSKDVIVKNIFVSIDPYQLNRMKAESASQKASIFLSCISPGQKIVAHGLGRVVESGNDKWKKGDLITGLLGWEEYSLVKPWPEPNKIEAVDQFPLSSYLSALGTSGLTAYAGLFHIGKPKKGDKVFVSAAAGSVGNLVGQYAKLAGCYIVGCAGSKKKVDLLKEKLGFDDVFNYKEEPDLKSALRRYFPDGIDIYFDNVGGEMLEVAIANMNAFGRVAACGAISEYTDKKKQAQIDMMDVIYKRITISGYLVSDYVHVYPDFVSMTSEHLNHGRMHAVEDISHGIENVPSAFVELFEGVNIGKKLVQFCKMNVENRYVTIKNPIEGKPLMSDFEVRTEQLTLEIQKGSKDVFVKNIFVSIDPYQLNRMKAESASQKASIFFSRISPGQKIDAHGLGRVVESGNDKWKKGDLITGLLGWEEYSLVKPWPEPNKIEAVDQFPLSSYLSALGTSGLTAYAGLFHIGKPKKGDKVFVSAAAGSVGNLVGQYAKLAGCYIVGCAGSKKKVDLLKEKLGFDDVFNYKEEPDLKSALRRYFPDGIDIYFDNVGGEMLEVAIANMNAFGRVAACGAISEYTDKKKQAQIDMMDVIYKRITISGYLVSDYVHVYPDFVSMTSEHLNHGRMHAVEDISHGIENVPSAFVELFEGVNIGKKLVQVLMFICVIIYEYFYIIFEILKRIFMNFLLKINYNNNIIIIK